MLTILGITFGPFVALGQMPQLLSRLFPFSRGLCHAYWAPNIWALYSFADRILISCECLLPYTYGLEGRRKVCTNFPLVAPRLGLPLNPDAINSVTRGLVGDSSFAVLPDVSPQTCFLLTLLFQAVPLVRLFRRPSWDNFIGGVAACGYASFLFGWHVHEKAILLVIIPFSLIALKDRRFLSAFRPLAVAGHVSLFPLLFTPAEFPIKTVYTLLWVALFLTAFDRLAPASSTTRFFLLDRLSTVYIASCIPLVAYCSLAHRAIFGDALAFLPLMLISLYSAVGVIGSWIGFMVVYLTA